MTTGSRDGRSGYLQHRLRPVRRDDNPLRQFLAHAAAGLAARRSTGFAACLTTSRTSGPEPAGMSKARLVITAVTVEKRPVSEVARTYRVARSWIYALLARYRAEGEAAFEPRSRRPKTSPTAISDRAVELITELRKELAGRGLDAGPHTIARHLEHHHQIKVSAATISRYLTRQGLVTPEPKKRPKSSYIRFAAEQPNERWQSDFIHWQLAGGQEVEIVSWLDDHSRLALSVTAHPVTTGQVTLAAFRGAVAAHGAPASTLTDIQAV
jgi:transposase